MYSAFGPVRLFAHRARLACKSKYIIIDVCAVAAGHERVRIARLCAPVHGGFLLFVCWCADAISFECTLAVFRIVCRDGKVKNVSERFENVLMINLVCQSLELEPK